jgi:hypothetical protein
MYMCLSSARLFVGFSYFLYIKVESRRFCFWVSPSYMSLLKNKLYVLVYLILKMLYRILHRILGLGVGGATIYDPT